MSRPSISTAIGHAQDVELLQRPGGDVARQEPERHERDDADHLAADRRLDVVEAGGIARGEDAHPDDAQEPRHPVHGHRPDGIVDAEAPLDQPAGVVGEHRGEHGQQEADRRRVDVGAGGHADDAGQAAAHRPERVAATDEVAAHEAAREAHRDDRGDRSQRRRAQVDVGPTRERGRRDHQARAVEGVEAGEDQHQPQQRDVQVVRLEDPHRAGSGVAPYPRAEVEEDPQREGAGHAVHHRRGDRVVEAEAQRHPAAGAPAPSGVEDPHDRARAARPAAGRPTGARARSGRPTGSTPSSTRTARTPGRRSG